MHPETAYCLAWLRTHAPQSAVLRYFEFPPLRHSGRAELDRDRDRRARELQLAHARRVVGILEGAR